MASNSDQYTPQQYRKYNGQSVFKALTAIGNEASADEVANFISQDIGEREEIILPEVKQVLRRGITNGFLVRNGKFYSFVGDDVNMQTDSARRRPTRSSNKRNVPRRIATASKSNYEEEEGTEEEVSEEEESVEDGSEHEDSAEMQEDSKPVFRRPKVKLYEIRRQSESENEDEESEQYYEDEPPRKRIRLQPKTSSKIVSIN